MIYSIKCFFKVDENIASNIVRVKYSVKSQIAVSVEVFFRNPNCLLNIIECLEIKSLILLFNERSIILLIKCNIEIGRLFCGLSQSPDLYIGVMEAIFKQFGN